MQLQTALFDPTDGASEATMSPTPFKLQLLKWIGNNTTTFGSRVTDGVYESLLDGMELEEMREHTQVNVLHYLMVDAKDNWWDRGRSYLCRMVDMLHMGYVDEVLFGREVIDRLLALAAEWKGLRPVAEARSEEHRRVL